MCSPIHSQRNVFILVQGEFVNSVSDEKCSTFAKEFVSIVSILQQFAVKQIYYFIVMYLRNSAKGQFEVVSIGTILVLFHAFSYNVLLPFNWTSKRLKGNLRFCTLKAGYIHVRP